MPDAEERPRGGFGMRIWASPLEGLGFVTMVLYLAMNGSGGRVPSVIAYLVLKAVVAGGAVSAARSKTVPCQARAAARSGRRAYACPASACR